MKFYLYFKISGKMFLLF